MAYNPNIPAPTNRVQDDLDAIRENFQHLDPLAQAVGELQAVSGLAPVANELQAVSELAPYVQALLDSRIVDHNLDVTNPPNGWYVRWDNGLQICSVRIKVGEYTSTRTHQGITIYRWTATWAFPAVFLQAPHVSGTCSLGDYRLLETVSLVGGEGSNSYIGFYASQITEFNSGYVYLIAVGRWK